MKKLINRPEDVVRQMLEGFMIVHPQLNLLSEHNVIVRADSGQHRGERVAVISGGGSGHEPAHAGYVGEGMLSAAVAGEVFTSPSPDAVLAAIRAVAGEAGALLVVKNYTGDRLNFGAAADMAQAEGIPVATVLVADDVALLGKEQGAGARGIAGTVFVHKIAGALAQAGQDLQTVAAAAQQTATAVATMGVALSAGIVPAMGKPSFSLADDEMELGLGIHGEPGVLRTRLRPADEIVADLVSTLVSAQQLEAREQVALLINNLGSTTPMELAIVARAALQVLERKGVDVQRIYAGTFMTSLETAGVSLSTLRLDPDRLQALDAPTSAPAWPRPQPSRVRGSRVSAVFSAPSAQRARPGVVTRAQRAVEAACQALKDAEARLNELDQVVGDGDLGTSLARGAHSIEANLSEYALDDPAELLRAVASTLQRLVGGSSGALYAVLLSRAATHLSGIDARNPHNWAIALLDGCEGVTQIGGASTGDRTMLDALVPFANTLKAELERQRPLREALDAAVLSAEKGAGETATMTPRFGRSSYLGDRAIGHPDPGAFAAVLWLRAIAGEF